MARVALVAVVNLVGWNILAVAASVFETRPGVSVWFPPTALVFVLLLVRGLRWWPLTLLSIPLHELLFGNDVAFGCVELLIYAAAVTAAYAGAAVALVRAGIDPGLRGLRDIAWFVAAACCAGPLAAAILQVSNLVAFGHLPPADALVSVLQFWAGDATGVGMLAPFLLVLLRRWPGLWTRRPAGSHAGFRWPPPAAWPGFAAEALALAAGLWLA